MSIQINNLSFQYNGTLKARLNNINIEIQENETVALLGVSGSGKSTLFNVLTSLYEPTEGEVCFKNCELIDLSYIRQSALDMLFPWKTAQENIEFALKERNISTQNNKNRIEDLLKVLKLEKHKDTYPEKLSGGEKKRLSFACGLSYSPKIILLDEAFTGVDLTLKLELWSFLKNEIEKAKASSFIITHDFDEAIYLADRLIFLNPNGNLCDEIITIDKKLKKSNQNIENFLSQSEIVDIKRKALNIFRNISA